MASRLQEFIFPPPTSFFITAMTLLPVISMAVVVLLEIRGKHLQYSKFCNLNPDQKPLVLKKQIKLPSRVGMVLVYAPAFLAGLASFWIFPDQGLRFLLVRSTLTFHYFKRNLESLFIHKYSGYMVLADAIMISSGYFMSTVILTYVQHLTQGFTEPATDTKYLGIVLFLAGISGNFYHHYILSKLRKNDGDKDYKIPRGGLFGLVLCPHYLFEIMGFVGICLISQTLYAWSFTLASTLYLIGRSYATRTWYLSKFEDFPKNVKALLPFVF